MQTVSTAENEGWRRRWARVAGLLLLAAFCSACLTPPPSVVVDDLLEPVSPPDRWLPTAADLGAAKLARAALIARTTTEPTDPSDERSIESRASKGEIPSTPEVESALDDLEATESSAEQDKLIPLAIDLRNATLDNPIAYRAMSRTLRKRWGLDPRLETRLDRTIDDDPIRLAKRRVFDGWHKLWARTFNAVAQPLGSSWITGFVLAPYQLANSIIHYFADFSNMEPLSMTGRQALTLRKDFLRAHPDTELTERLEPKIAKAQIKLEKTLALRRVRASEDALDANIDELAHHQASVALSILSAHPEENGRLRKRARKAQERASERIAETTRRRLESLEARPAKPALQPLERELAIRLLRMPKGANDVSLELAEYRELGGEEAEGREEFVRAMLEHEADRDFGSRMRLKKIISQAPKHDAMARHARTLLDDDWQNPYGAFRRLERIANRDELAWRLAGEWVRRTRYPNLPTPIAYLVDAPTIAITIILAPLRAMISPWTGTPDFRRGPSLAAYRYLRRFPEGAEQQVVLDWLYDYEYDMERYGRALRLADLIPDFDPELRAELVEKTAGERLARVDKLDRRDNRASVLKGVAREFPDSDGGRDAGLRVRAELEDASAQHIRITKSFLLENPDVAGRNGFGLNPRLLNDDDSDGELHPEGVVLRGGRLIEIRLVAEKGDKKDPPESRKRKVSRARLTRVAAALDEAVQRNSLVDVGARFEPDAGRDVYLERASLGLTEEPDFRPTAESTFVYQSLRERYGLVRGRDSVLPFDLVLRGSLDDMALGAFPRWRPPRETPDAFLYR